MKSILSSKVSVNLFAIQVVKSLIICLGVICGVSGYGQVVEWSLTSNGNPTVNDPNTSATDFIGSGIGPITFGSTGAYANNWSTGSLNTGKYFEVSTSPNVGYNINITDFNFGERRSGAGIRNYEVRYSKDGFSTFTTISSQSVGDNTSERDGSIGGLNIDVLDGETITFRLYGYNAEGATGTWRINDGTLNIDGTVSPSIITTQVQFSSVDYSENEANGTIDICVGIFNEDVNPTSVDVVMISPAGVHLSSFSQTLVFPSNSNTSQCATINWSDNSDCDGNENYTFELQNIAGGNSATIGSQNSTELSIIDEEQTSGTIAFQGFEGSGWNYSITPSGYSNSSNLWDITANNGPISIPSEGNSFWGIRDLNNSEGGGNFDHIIEFDNFSVIGLTNVSIEFDYYTAGFEASDYLQYQIALDGGAFDAPVDLHDNTGNWVTETINIPDGSSSIQLRLIGNQNGQSDYGGLDNIKIIGEGCSSCSEPTAESIFDLNTPSFLESTSATFNWTAGDGSDRIMVLREDIDVSSLPVDGTTYVANSSFGSGDDIGTNEYVVYNGSDETLALTNLTPGTEYFAKIFEYNCLPGNEDYLTSGSPASDVFITPPDNPNSFDEGCVGNSSIDLSWTAPPTGNFDGYLLVARENTVPHSVNSLDPNSQSFNSDYSLAPTFGGTPELSRVLYRGPNLSATVTNLTPGSDYTFEVLTYTIGSSGYKYSSGRTTSQIIELQDVTSLTGTPNATSVALSWTVDPSCIDELIVVASDAGSVVNVPTGTGYTVNSSSFTDGLNPTLNPSERVVYSGLGSNVTVTDLTTDQTYCFKIFVRNGAVWSTGTELCETPRISTSLEPGDVIIISVSTNIGQSRDQICFVSHQSITTNTAIDFTDNGYERLNAGLWGDTEGIIRIERTGGTIPAGTPICIEGIGTSNSGGFNVIVCGTTDPNWTVSSLDPPIGFNLTTSDQVWVMQGGVWDNPSGSHNANYTGSVLYGWSSSGWENNPGYNSTSGSTIYPNSSCLNTNLSSLSQDFAKYTGPTSVASNIEWITRVNQEANWTEYNSFSAFSDSIPQYTDSCITFLYGGSPASGVWTGATDTDWFECSNWSNLKVPDDNTDVQIPLVANLPIIGSNTAETNSLEISSGSSLTINQVSSRIEIHGNFTIEGTLAQSAGNIAFTGSSNQTITDNDPGIGTIALSGLELDNSAGNLLTDEIITISDNFTATQGIFELGENSYVHFLTNATTTSASNTSYIDGAVRKTVGTTTNFTFPIGDSNVNGNFYQPARVFGQPSGTSVIEAQYTLEAHPFAGIYYDGESNAAGDNHEIGNCDYWSINRISGTGNPQLALTYTNSNPLYCNEVAAPEFMRIASLNAINEWDLTSSGDSGNEIVMSTTIGTPVTGGSYGDFSFYSDGGDDFNILPIELTYFDAKALSSTVMTSWQTSSETNNDFFTLERSADLRSFVPIATIDGAGNSHVELNYNFEDLAPLPGLSYYRLKQSDFDGASAYSEIRAVEFKSEGLFELLNAYRTDNRLAISYRSDAPSIAIEIFDVTGQRVFNAFKLNDGLFTTVYLNLQRGAYVLRISNSMEYKSRKFIW